MKTQKSGSTANVERRWVDTDTVIENPTTWLGFDKKA